jgi:glycosyltransferase involved in cell wall biosynthesis
MMIVNRGTSMSFPLSKVKVQIVSRYVPSENRAGHFTYVLDFMRYLQQTGCIVELVVLDPWCQESHISQTVRDIANVVMMPSSFLKSGEQLYNTISIKSLFRPLYSHLPYNVLHPVRKVVYRLRGESPPGVHQHDAFATHEEIAFVMARFAEFQPDLIITNQTYLGNIFDHLDNTHSILKVVLTIHIEHQRSKDFQKGGLRSHDSLWDWEKESKLLQKADVLLAIQEDDAKILREMAPQSEVFYTPMSAQYHSHDATNQVSQRCLFVGSDIDHNVYGLRWFLESVWPLVLHTVPECSLHVCGTVCSKIQGPYQNARILGRVDNVQLEYAAAEVCLIPLVVGSGLKIKLVEALSHGRACVSTSVGVQGIQEITNKAVFVADTPEDFARAVITVLKSPEKRKAMEDQARKYVTEQLAPEKAYQPFVERISRHVQQKSI